MDKNRAYPQSRELLHSTEYIVIQLEKKSYTSCTSFAQKSEKDKEERKKNGQRWDDLLPWRPSEKKYTYGVNSLLSHPMIH